MARVHATQIDTIAVYWEDKYTHLGNWVGKLPDKSYFREQGSSRDLSRLDYMNGGPPLKQKAPNSESRNVSKWATTSSTF